MTVLSHQNGEHTHQTSEVLAERIETLLHLSVDINNLNRIIRRIAHIVVFAVLSVLLGLTVLSGGKLFWLLLFPFLWSYVDEATKPMIQGRHFSWFDVWLNLSGCIIGYAILTAVIPIRL